MITQEKRNLQLKVEMVSQYAPSQFPMQDGRTLQNSLFKTAIVGCSYQR